MRRTLLIYEQTVEREGEEVWALWEEVGSRGLDTWTELPAVYAIPNGSDSQPGGKSIPRALGKEEGRCARCCASTVGIT